MKNTINFGAIMKIAGSIVLAAIIGFGLGSCENPAGSRETLQNQNLTIAGTFDSQNGGSLAKFYATAGNGAKSAARAIGESDFALEGLLEDGDITFRLKGNYNSVTGTYTLSAAGSVIRYTISGTFNSTGKAETGKAVIQVKSGDVWTSIEADITTAGTAPSIDTSGVIVDETPGGIPINMRGIWRDDTDASYYAMVNAFSVNLYEKADAGWIETDTLYFTDVTTAGGVTSGITAFMGWDYDKLDTDTAYQWQNDMLMAFTSLKYPGKTPIMNFSELNNLYLESLMTGPGGGVDRVKAAFGEPYASAIYTVNHNEEWKFMYFVPDWSIFETDMADFNEAFYYYFNKAANDPEFPEYTLKSDAYKNDLAALLDRYPVLRAKYQITLYYNDSYDIVPGSEDVSWVDLYEKWTSLAAAWGTSNGYILADINLYDQLWSSGFEDTWLTEVYGKDGDYYCQWYSKMAVKLQGGKLYTGNYYKPDSNGGNEPAPDPSYIPAIYSVKNHNQVSSLTKLDWEPYGLSR